MGTNLANVDWRLLARPQPDGYDTQIIASLAAERYGFVASTPTPPVFFGGRVALRQSPHPMSEHLVAAPLDHRNLARAEEILLRVWPEIHAQCTELLVELWPLMDTRYADDDSMSGCSCGNTDRFGGICVTVQSPTGLAEGIVHELGHWKLHAMGVHLEDWSALVANDPAARYVSPVRKDIERPMGAVLHAQYSYVHVLALDAAMAEAGERPPMLEMNYRRILEGRETLRAYWTPDSIGKEFAAGLADWTDDVLTAATRFVGG